MKSYLSVADAAKLACVSIHTIRYHIDRGNLSYKFISYRYWIEISSLRQLYRLGSGGLNATEKKIYDLG